MTHLTKSWSSSCATWTKNGGDKVGLPPSNTIGLAYDRITTPVMRRAAELWAEIRLRGLPTAADQSLDADAILAAQATLIGAAGDTVILATGNPAYLTRFRGVDARDWASISSKTDRLGLFSNPFASSIIPSVAWRQRAASVTSGSHRSGRLRRAGRGRSRGAPFRRDAGRTADPVSHRSAWR